MARVWLIERVRLGATSDLDANDGSNDVDQRIENHGLFRSSEKRDKKHGMRFLSHTKMASGNPIPA